ncbi:hypothetical protein CPT_Sycamore_016 [Streptomyces phage Sycamore]|uniref:Minor tail protein n=1 Tax=Streptomyces phage Sycamore TaxID=2767589 RepID=A0A873WJ97_9CAUD|nr:hypothetical protein CPT_Sycamore_016 [Streptomyces phage Sycamore]
MARPGTTEPDLVGELRKMQGRLDALERAPVPQTVFDQYPSVEWAAQGRPMVSGNRWTSCGVANVSGMKFDRVEVKYITDWILKGRSEAEIRLAAFRHDYASQFKECISTTDVVRLVGGTRVVGVGKWRWIHGIGFGWDYTDDDNAIYTIELQHRNPDDCLQKEDPSTQLFAPYKNSDKAAPSGFDQLFYNNGANQGVWIWSNLMKYANSKWSNDGTPADYAWNSIPGNWDGAYSVSNMHYCVGLSQERLPGASEKGYHWYVGGESKFVRAGDIAEPYLSV